MKTIEKLMLEEHKRLDNLLDDLERDLEDYEKTRKNFDCFKWSLEKHFFVEEKIIFDSFVMISGEETNDIFHLLEDHSKIIKLLKIIGRQLNNKIKPQLHELKNILSTHRDFEDEGFYPNLDERLNLEQKKKISERINEIVSC